MTLPNLDPAVMIDSYMKSHRSANRPLISDLVTWKHVFKKKTTPFFFKALEPSFGLLREK